MPSISDPTVPRIQMGIVSPCSTCKNQLDESKDGKPACPRRALRAFAGKKAADGQPLSPSFSPALLTGSENIPDSTPDSLVNPVYSDNQGHILVWVAHLQDNLGIHDEQGNVVVPPLSALPESDRDSFDTEHIQCNNLPYVVRETEAAYFQSGAYREWDAVECTGLRTFQLDPTTSGSVTDFDPVKIEGFARKVNFAFGFPRRKVDVDLHPRGT